MEHRVMIKDKSLLFIFSCFSNHFPPAAFIFQVYSITVPRESRKPSPLEEQKETGSNAKEEIEMDHYEMVENLRTKANVTYEEAKAALEASDWDMLDALVLLESEGKVNSAPEYTTKEKADETRRTTCKEKGNLSKLGAWIRKMFVLGNKNQFVISRKGSELVAMPITVMALLMVLVWPFSLIVLFAGFFLGTRYAFRGPDINTTITDFVNKAQDKAAVTVEAQVE